jgi:hypothetical protein
MADERDAALDKHAQLGVPGRNARVICLFRSLPADRESRAPHGRG